MLMQTINGKGGRRCKRHTISRILFDIRIKIWEFIHTQLFYFYRRNWDSEILYETLKLDQNLSRWTIYSNKFMWSNFSITHTHTINWTQKSLWICFSKWNEESSIYIHFSWLTTKQNEFTGNINEWPREQKKKKHENGHTKNRGIYVNGWMESSCGKQTKNNNQIDHKNIACFCWAPTEQKKKIKLSHYINLLYLLAIFMGGIVTTRTLALLIPFGAVCICVCVRVEIHNFWDHDKNNTRNKNSSECWMRAFVICTWKCTHENHYGQRILCELWHFDGNTRHNHSDTIKCSGEKRKRHAFAIRFHMETDYLSLSVCVCVVKFAGIVRPICSSAEDTQASH